VRRVLAALFFLSVSLWCHAGEGIPVAADPALDARVQALSEELRCLVCQNQNLADSHAELAIDLKNQVREMLQAGRSEKEVIDYMVRRYGDFVLYRPPVKSTTWLLWGGPFILFAAALGFLFFKLRDRSRTTTDPLSQSEREVAARLLARAGEPE
jgi:cytochrome c-type biogenesis protein CcmH